MGIQTSQILRPLDSMYGIEMLGGMSEQPKMTFYRWDKGMQTIITMPNLPADPASMRCYLAKGFSLTPEGVKKE